MNENMPTASIPPPPRPPVSELLNSAAKPNDSPLLTSTSGHATLLDDPGTGEPSNYSSRSAYAASEPSSSDEIEMEPITPAGHRRRRSSLMQGGNGGSQDRSSRSRTHSRNPGDLPEEPTTPEGQNVTGSGSRAQEIGDDGFSDEDLHDDEETGLTNKDKQRKRHKRRRNTRLDNRIARETISAEEKKEADKHVLRKLVINGTLILLWYLFSLSISLYNKWMFDADRLNFAFPLFTTSLHMLVQFGLATLVLYFVPSLRPTNGQHHSDLGRSRHESEPERPLMTKMYYLTRIGPCGAATGLDIGLGNMSLKFITLTFYTMCKSSSLAFVLIFAFLFRLETPTLRLVAIIATMTLGVILMVSGEVEFKLGGFLLVISAAFFSGFRWGLTQILLLRNPATSNPFSSIFFLAPVMFVTLICIAIPVEGFGPLIGGIKNLAEVWGTLWTPIFLIFPGCIAFLMTASEFALLQRTSVVTLSIAGIFKEVVTISAAALVFEDRLTPINFVGLITTMAAIVAYNWIKIKTMRSQAQIEVHRGHMDISSGSSSSNSGSDADIDDGGEETGLLRNSTEIEDHLVTADGDIIPNPQASSHSAGESRVVQGHRGN